MDNNNEKKLFELYTLAELSYKQHFKDISNENLLYPKGWYNEKNYLLKIKLIAEAIKTNTLIVDTSLFKEVVSKKNIR